jgi:hypothetical protein
MAGQHREQEGNSEQRRAKAREARREGKLPSEVSATLGASKQRKSAPNNASHQQKLDQQHEGKEAKYAKGTREKPRPGNRETDPKRTSRFT